MSPLGESGRSAEDEWWQRLYGDPPDERDAAARAGDSLDEHFATAARAAGGAAPDPAAEPPPTPSEFAPPGEHTSTGEPGAGGERWWEGPPPPRLPDASSREEPVAEPAWDEPSWDEPTAEPAAEPAWENPDFEDTDLEAPPSGGDRPQPPRRESPGWESPPDPPWPEEPSRPPGTVPALPAGWAPAGGEPLPPPPPPPAPAPPPEPVAEPVAEPPRGGDAEPAVWPLADPDRLDGYEPDTLLDGARHGTLTLRVAAVRGEAARHRGEPRSETMLTARFGSGADAVLLVALAGGPRFTPEAFRAARDVCRTVGEVVGRNSGRLAEDLRGANRGALRPGLQRLTDRAYLALGLRPGGGDGEPTVGLRCMLVPLDPASGARVCFGTGGGGMFRLRGGRWQDLDPDPLDQGFRFQVSMARRGDVLLVCGSGLTMALRRMPELPDRLARCWAPPSAPPSLAEFLADATIPVDGYGGDRGAAALWDE